MNKIFYSLLVLPIMLGASVASAEVGGTITRSINTPAASPEQTPIVTVYDKTNPEVMPINRPVVETAFDKSVNVLITGLLQIVSWEGESGKLSFTATNYSINNGCNTLFGTYKVSGTKIELGSSASTMMACQPELMAADQTLAKNLAVIKNINFAEGKLVLSGEKTQLKFAPTFAIKK